MKECLNVGEKVRELTPEGCRLLETNSLSCVPGGADNGLLGISSESVLQPESSR